MDKLYLQSVVEKISSIEDKNFFNSLCLALSEVIDAQFVFVATLDKEKQLATTLSLAAHHEIVDNFSYSLIGTPCAEVSCGKISIFPDNTQQCFPRDTLLTDMQIKGYLGIPLRNQFGEIVAILVSLFQQPIESCDEIITFFQLFTGLVEKEFQKESVLNQLEFANQVIQDSQESIFFCDQDCNITYANNALTELTEYTNDELLGQNPRIFKSGNHDYEFYRKFWSQLTTQGSWIGELVNRKKSGEIYHAYTSINRIIDSHGNVNYVAMLLDITETVKTQEKINYQANHDSLTGLKNRFYFSEQLCMRISEQVAPVAMTCMQPFAVIVFDMMGFNEINNTYGSSFGDHLLVEVGKRLRAELSENIPSRVDGDGFAIIVPYHSTDELTALTEQISATGKNHFVVDGTHISVNFSFGISTFEINDYQNQKPQTLAHQLITQAEQAARQAKQTNNPSALIYDQSMEDAVNALADTKQALNKAINNQELQVFFQPVVDIEHCKVVKLEALVRWQRNGSWISPDTFIPIAEKTGLIVPLGEFVLKQSCQQIVALKALGFDDIVINVNRSIFEFPANDKAENPWLATINSHGICHEQITFELTESVLAPENGNHLNCLKQLQKAGCKVALDDFGTGYSSLSYLRRFPVNYLKIDKSFIQEMAENNSDKVLISSIIQMTSALGINVVAEGVETAEHVSILNELGCKLIQGYYFAKPMPAEELHAFLKSPLKK